MYKLNPDRVSPSPDYVPLNESSLDGNEWDYLKHCLDSTSLSSDGEYVRRLEEMTADHAGMRYGVATSSATVALQTALQVVGVEPDDEVILSALTMPRPALAVKAVG